MKHVTLNEGGSMSQSGNSPRRTHCITSKIQNKMPAIVITILFITIVLAVRHVVDLNAASLSNEFRQHSELIADHIQRESAAEIAAVNAMDALFYSNGRVEYAEFRKFSAAVRSKTDVLSTLEWVPMVGGSDVRDFEQWAHQHGVPGFHIFGQSDAYDPSTDHFPVTFVDPLEGNQQAIGFDLATNPQRKLAMQRASSTGQVTLTEPVVLVQDGQRAVLAFSPVFSEEQPQTSSDKRRKSLRGFALGVIRVSRLMQQGLWGVDLSKVDYWLRDETDPEHVVDLSSNTSGPPRDLTFSSVFLPHAHLGLESTIGFDVGGRRWVLHTMPTRSFVINRLSGASCIKPGRVFADMYSYL